MKRFLNLLLAGVLAVSTAACSSSSGNTTEEHAQGTYIAGTYTGKGQGFGGKVTVTITTDTDQITAVTVEGKDETESVGGAHLDELGQQILDAQSSEIDGVSGATMTSNGVKAAAADAIAQAKG